MKGRQNWRWTDNIVDWSSLTISTTVRVTEDKSSLFDGIKPRRYRQRCSSRLWICPECFWHQRSHPKSPASCVPACQTTFMVTQSSCSRQQCIQCPQNSKSRLDAKARTTSPHDCQTDYTGMSSASLRAMDFSWRSVELEGATVLC